MNKALLGDFQAPSSKYRGAPFWAWNGKLDPVELRRQIRLMKEMGLGGFFMHSRVGLDTDYLSDEWFKCVEACIDEAEKLDMQAWLYDEDRWPSGAAGGLVTQNPKYRMRHLKLKLLKPGTAFKRTKDTVAVFVAKVDGAIASNVRLIPPGKKAAPAPDETILHFGVELEEPSDWYNGYTYLDTMNHEAVREFIRVTHEAYRKRFGKHFGKRVPGIFTDEPDHGDVLTIQSGDAPGAKLTWTGQLTAVFRKRYGYDLIPHLPELVFDVDGQPVSQARYHFHDCTTHLFVDAFVRQIGEWSGRNKMLFTGHLMMEDSLWSQADRVGACMRSYEHMQAPGMDMLTENWRIFATAKQVSSAAHQFGRKWRLTETYGCTGWDFPFAGHKALGDWQLALGINLRCQHLSWYTMQGEAKRDYPAAIFYQSPWWNLYSKVEDYYARLHAVMTRGTEVRDLLVIHPVESMWLTFRKDADQNPDRQQLEASFMTVTDLLLGGHVDFDYGDEELLSRHARIVKKGGRPELHFGEAVYRAVLVPSQISMRKTTLNLLQKFRSAGGTVVFAGRQAAYLDALASSAVTDFARTCACVEIAGAEILKAVEPVARRVSIADAAGCEATAALYLLREDRQNFYLFICNTGEDFVAEQKQNQFKSQARDRRLAYPDIRVRGFADCVGHPVELNPETGATSAADAVKDGAGWEVRTSLPALGSRLFVFPKKSGSAQPALPAVPQLLRTEAFGQGAWDYRLSEANVLVLDRCRYRISNGDWQPVTEILHVDDNLRKAIGIKPRGGNMVQPWARKQPALPRTVSVTLAYNFDVQSRPSGDLFLAIEQPGDFRITLNGVAVNTDSECGWWTDRSLRKLRIDPSDLKNGLNELQLEIVYPETHSGLEIVYLLGNFGARVDGTAIAMTSLPGALAIGDWCEQGLPFYAGHVAYCRTIQPVLAEGERAFVCVPEYRGMGVRVLVDGRPAGVIGWQPNEIEITALLGDKPVELAVEVIGHRRNSHGPFHINTKWPSWTGPYQFKCALDTWIDGYQLVPCGLMSPPAIEIRKQ
ncbi:MAG: glycosyl hydrolase [bacterium]